MGRKPRKWIFLTISARRAALYVAAGAALLMIAAFVLPGLLGNGSTAEENTAPPLQNTPKQSIAVEVIRPKQTQPTPVALPDPLRAENGAYTIAWITDTQHYSREYPETFYAMTRFLQDNRNRMNLGYVAHTGDLVHHYDDEAQWDVAVRAMQTIADIPGGVLAGNHDVGTSRGDFTYYKKYFGEASQSSRACYGESYQDNRCHYDLVQLGDTKYLFVYASYEPDGDCIHWVNETLARYPERIGVLCVHDYFKNDLTLSDSGKALYKKVVRSNPNLYLVLCGHRYQVGYVEDTFDDDGDGNVERRVYQIMANYQAAGDVGGSGYLRLMQVDETAGVIRNYTYSPVLDDYTYFDQPEALEEKYASDPSQEEFILPIPWR